MICEYCGCVFCPENDFTPASGSVQLYCSYTCKKRANHKRKPANVVTPEYMLSVFASFQGSVSVGKMSTKRNKHRKLRHK